jgi:DNA-binding CsgD family transcriptional regulator
VKPKIRLNTRDMDMVSRRMQGQTYKAIGQAWGVSATTAYTTVERVRARYKAAERRIQPIIRLGGVAYMAPGAPADLFSPIELKLNLHSPDLFVGDSESRDYTE